MESLYGCPEYIRIAAWELFFSDSRSVVSVVTQFHSERIYRKDFRNSAEAHDVSRVLPDHSRWRDQARYQSSSGREVKSRTLKHG